MTSDSITEQAARLLCLALHRSLWPVRPDDNGKACPSCLRHADDLADARLLAHQAPATEPSGWFETGVGNLTAQDVGKRVEVPGEHDALGRLECAERVTPDDGHTHVRIRHDDGGSWSSTLPHATPIQVQHQAPAPATEDEAAEVEWAVRGARGCSPAMSESSARVFAERNSDRYTLVQRRPGTTDPWREVSS